MEKLPQYIYHKGKKIYLYEDQESLQSITINSLDDLKIFYSVEELYSFRGQSVSDWKLSSTLERYSGEVCPLELENIVNNTYKEQMKRKSINLDDIADLQHYGAPTRFLDWTSSLNIALYFATSDNIKSDAAIFCLRNIVHSSQTFSIEEILRAHGVLISANTSNKEKLLSKFTHQQEKNYRVLAQKGYFIYPNSAKYTFEESLSYTLGNLSINYQISDILFIDDILLRSSLIKVVIPYRLKTEILNYLNEKDIKEEIIYPDYQDDFLPTVSPIIKKIKTLVN